MAILIPEHRGQSGQLNYRNEYYQLMDQKVSFYTFGCRLNQAETAILQQSFEKKGYRVVDFSEPADIVLVNTCTVTEKSDADTRRLVHKIHRINPGARIALIGCQAQVQREQLLQMPQVQWVIGNARKMEIIDILQKTIDQDTPSVITPAISRNSFTNPVAGIDANHTRANVKIQDGCDFFCSFCIVPYARGRARSRQFDDIESEAKLLIAAGHRELVLTGINVGNYQYQNKDLLDVIDNLERLEGLARLRISSIEFTTISTRLLEQIATHAKLCRFLHIPLQSGSDDILTAMNRHYQAQEFVEFLLQAYRSVAKICLGTDIIVGFPGESGRHFDETYDLLEQLPFSYFHVFSYSDRPLSKSRKLPDKVSAAEIDRRSKILRELSSQKRRRYFEKFIDSVETVLFEQKKNGFWTGLTDTFIRVKVKSTSNLYNEMVPVRLEGIDNQKMIGSLQ